MAMLLDDQPLSGEMSKSDFENLFRIAELIITDDGIKAEFFKKLARARTKNRGLFHEAGPRRLPRPDDTEYNISGEKLSKDDISEISKMRSLRRLVMRGCIIGPDMFGDRLGGLERLESLEELDLSGTGLGHGDTRTIGRIRNLKALVMQECVIRPDMFGDRLGSLNNMHNLKYINTYGVELCEKDRSVLHALSLRGVEVWC